MKNITFLFAFVFGFGIYSQLEARDLSYKIGLGYQQVYTNGFVADGLGLGEGAFHTPRQVSGVAASYGLTNDMILGGFFGMTSNFNQFLVGPSFRYNVHRLLVRDSRFWQHLNIFTQASFFFKGGSDVNTGVTLQLPYVGVEVFPFRDTHFSIQSSFGLTIDLVKKSMVGLTQGAFVGDMGLRYYF